MKGDFSQVRFDSTKRYSGVRMQQGRVQLDADWNEQVDISAYRASTQALDVIGQSGAPLSDAGFMLAAKATDLPSEQQSAAAGQAPLAVGDFFICAGRYYAGGMLCENDSPVAYSRQPDLPDAKLPGADASPPASTEAPLFYLAYLDAWERHVTALDDTDLREPALGGPDTTTRTKLVWQVKLYPVTDKTPSSVLAAWTACTAPSTGKLDARAQPAPPAAEDPCVLAPTAGYRRVDNQLYRVEVHDVPRNGEPGGPTFKWSRDNGSVVAACTILPGKTLSVSSLGPDQVLSFKKGDWVEVIDDTHELAAEPGVLVHITDVGANTLTIDTAVVSSDFTRNPKVRRWDTIGDSAIQTITTPADNGGYLSLEAGVEVRFELGTFKTGDYWLIPARTTTGNVLWPLTGAQPPQGIRHHYARLALLSFDGSKLTVEREYRQFFAPTTEQTSLFLLGGDGQLAPPGQALLQPLQAGVSNGGRPVAGATVRFVVTSGHGSLEGAGSPVDIVTDAQGVASCHFTPDVKNASQQVTATLLDADGAPIHLPIHFNARLDGSGLDPGMHVVSMTLGGKKPLHNDSDVTVAQLAEGIDIVCDAEVASESVSRATCFLTLELPFTPDAFGYQNVTLNAAPSVDSKTIQWIPAEETSNWLTGDLSNSIKGDRLLARLTLLGNFIWSNEVPPRYLDGDVVGLAKSPQDGPFTAIQLPSGNGRLGGTLEMWFWLVKGEVTVTIDPPNAAVQAAGSVASGIQRTVAFTVTVQGTHNKGVNFTLERIPADGTDVEHIAVDPGGGPVDPGGGNDVGQIVKGSSTGQWIYQPPEIQVRSASVRVTASSKASPDSSASATVTIFKVVF